MSNWKHLIPRGQDSKHDLTAPQDEQSNCACKPTVDKENKVIRHKSLLAALIMITLVMVTGCATFRPFAPKAEPEPLVAEVECTKPVAIAEVTAVTRDLSKQNFAFGGKSQHAPSAAETIFR